MSKITTDVAEAMKPILEITVSDEAKQFLERLERASRGLPAWIPVSDRLPEHPTDSVLVFDGAGISIGHYEYFDDRLLWHIDGEDNLIDITHWQPLPPPPAP